MNIGIFLVVAGFLAYMATSINRNISQGISSIGFFNEEFEGQYTYDTLFRIGDNINHFDLNGERLFIAAEQSLYIYDTDGNRQHSFFVGQGVRDVTVSKDEIYLLYPTRIAVYSMKGQLIREWNACSELSDYCSFTVAGNAVFVTDVENKDICKYTTEGVLVKFIKSPTGFIIPSYSFDIDCWNDTIYCVNSGRHCIETYTQNGDFITSLGSAGAEAGYFTGCCNPVHISFTSDGTLITSEKGNPRISNFERNGHFNEVWLNNKHLGNGTNACEAKALDDKLYVAIKKTITVFKINNI